MEVTCLSVPNPNSYLICAGIKDVENRGFGTDYRGTLYIHSSGRFSIRGMPDFDDCPVPVIHEFNRFMDKIQEIEAQGQFIGIPEHGVQVVLKQENQQPEEAVNEYNLLADVYHHHDENPRKPFFRAHAIVGTVSLVDVVKDSKSQWAEDGYHHWIFRHAKLFAKPITGVKMSRTGLWKYQLPDE